MLPADEETKREKEERKKEIRIYRRHLRDQCRPMEMTDEEFRKHFLLSQQKFAALCSDLIPLLPTAKRRTAVRPEIKILAALQFYTSGSHQKNVGINSLLGLSQSSTSGFIEEVTQALNSPRIVLKYIRFPRSLAEREAISKRFEEKFGFPGVLGCIGRTHVAVLRPSESEGAYFNALNYHSLNVLLICDADMRVLHVDASFGAAADDNHVWYSCRVYPRMRDLHKNGETFYFLGDSAYEQRPFMMTPIPNASPNSPEEHYNTELNHTRGVIENCINKLKMRFRCLLAHKPLNYTPVKAGKIVNACVVLNNLINEEAVEMDENELAQDNARQPPSTPPLNLDEMEDEVTLNSDHWSPRSPVGDDVRERLVRSLWGEQHNY